MHIVDIKKGKGDRMNIEPTYAGIALMPIMIGINEAIKSFGVKTKYIPFINLLIGLAIGIFFFSEDIKKGAVYGLYLAFGSSGLFSSTKHVTKEYRKNKAKKQASK